MNKLCFNNRILSIVLVLNIIISSLLGFDISSSAINADSGVYLVNSTFGEEYIHNKGYLLIIVVSLILVLGVSIGYLQALILIGKKRMLA